MKPHNYEYLNAMSNHPAGRGAPGRKTPHSFQVPRPVDHPHLDQPTVKDDENGARYYRNQADKVGGILLILLVIIAVGLLIAAGGKLAWAVLPWLM
ncbi:hypothetical protein [Corynebacterium sp.]|uniref:hypothetical protein n=1 Tax=Corynebacterium sp. TaxID=1720 RepID=UPI003B3B51BB